MFGRKKIQSEIENLQKQTASFTFAHNEGTPVFKIELKDIAPYLLRNNIIISSFGYPHPENDAINRVVVNALHLKSDFETTTIRCIILRKDNPKEIVNEIFARLNQGAVELTPQEIRHAVYPGKFNSLLIELAENSVIKNFKTTENSITQKDGREAEEMILRFFALNNNLDDYNNKLSKYLDKYMEGMHQSNEDEIASKKELFGKTLNRVLKVFNEEDLFKNLGRSQQRQSIAIYDLVMYTFSNLTDEFVDQNKVELYNKFKELFENEEFNKTLSGGVQQKYSILKRRDLLKEKIDTLI